MTQTIHPTAIIDPKAKIGNNVTVGPYCIIGPDVEIGDGCHFHSHVVIDGLTTMGTGTSFPLPPSAPPQI